MNMHLNLQEGLALYRMLADGSSDIVLKTDRKGYIVDASPAIAQLGLADAQAHVGVHLLDLVREDGRPVIAGAHGDAVAGREDGSWVEFPAITPDQRESWYRFQARALRGEDGEIYGALSLMRSIDEQRTLREQLFTATYTDPLTRLTNRSAFVSMLDHMIVDGMKGCLGLFSIDFFRSINMKHGQHTGDEVLCIFADLLREMLRSDDIISRIGSERFAVLLPRTSAEQAEAICSRVVTTLADLRQKVGDCQFAITASAGVAQIEGSLDSTMERAEMALFVAKAKGRNRLEMERRDAPRAKAPSPSDPAHFNRRHDDPR
ncbi:GGDEF domain-containing protein [Novosphingobium sp. 1949]|uniref:GGDEF domain-containing protein n=1 Tax=Novosphingobium organovorum TaxID=2930092 RepID=A0ABT0BE97_9SPHN|nr:sensor domain-containing diguanylate cyclase [Novosphingobium organovorum]MCJ2183396.1 GGDEF domain-containing protein [Novosphingobium organovorum]